MIFCVVTHVIHHQQYNSYMAYAPYVREMNLWTSDNDSIIIVAPLVDDTPKAIDIAYKNKNIRFVSIPYFNLTSTSELLKTILKLPILFFQIFKGMYLADHIHLRCPGNVGLLGCLVQILFPWKKKSAKYAGNWDWNSTQPLSYRLQQKILRNTFLTRNMKVLVYGDWNETKNIKPFFTASYSEKEIVDTPPNVFMKNKPIKLIYIGGLLEGKRPMLSLKVSRRLGEIGYKNEIHFYGDGHERFKLEDYIEKNSMQSTAFLHGNVDAEQVKKALQDSHFLIFISKSEGWPKAVAESMFWGCLPLTSAVSCVPEMIGYGQRGELIAPDADLIVEKIVYYIQHPNEYHLKCNKAMKWSREFTLEKFEREIGQILK